MGDSGRVGELGTTGYTGAWWAGVVAGTAITSRVAGRLSAGLRTPRSGAVVCLMLMLATYGPSLSGGFVHEDDRQAHTWQGWQELRPTSRRLTHWLIVGQQAVLGSSARAARSMSLGLHLVNGTLLYVLASSIVPASVAILALGLFWLHPLNTEAVGYAANASELLMACCALLALIAADRGRLVLAWIACACAVLAKEPGIAAFLLVPAWLWSRDRLSWRVALAWGLSLALPMVLAWPLIAPYVAGWPDARDLGRNVTAYSTLLMKWILPVGQTPMPDWWWMTTAHAQLGLALAAIAGIVAWHWKASRMACALILATLAPRMVWWLPGGPREHHLYLASAVLSVASAALLWRWTAPKESYV